MYEKLARATKQSYGGKKALPADAPVKPPPAFFPQLPRCLIQEVMGGATIRNHRTYLATTLQGRSRGDKYPTR